MKSKVYFIKTDTNEPSGSIEHKISKLITESKVLSSAVSAKDRVAVKMHFGEEGNTGYIRGEYVKVIIQALKNLKAQPFLVDSNTLYKGKRATSLEHLQLAKEHGFSQASMGVAVVIPDETKDNCVVDVPLNGQFIKTAKIIRPIVEADALLGLAHFKGHIMTGFGGALKNFGMGAASRRGKLEQHSSVSPLVIIDECIGCGICVDNCPVQAIILKEKKAQINNSICIGCATCIAVCPQAAIDVPWEHGASTIAQKMAEYAQAALAKRKGKCAFLNFIIKVTKECDCLAKDDPREVDDVGIAASVDPVALDKACVDLVNQKAGKDLFKELHLSRSWMTQLIHAQKIGLGTLDYELIKV